MKKLLVLMCLMLPLYGQMTDTDKEVTEQEQREIRQNLAQQKMVQLNRDRWVRSDWDKFEQMHNRMHMKKLDHKGYKIKKPTKTHRVLSYVFVGGISFWIGNEYAKKSHHKSSYKKRPYEWERSKSQ